MMWLAMLLGSPPPAVASADSVELMVLTEVDADRAKPGDVVKLRLNRAVTLPDGTAVPVGAPGFGQVVSRSASGLALKRGALSVRIVRLSCDGRDIPLTGDFSTAGRGGSSDDALKAMLAPMYLPLARGHSARLKAGEVLVAHLASPRDAERPLSSEPQRQPE